MNNDNPLEGLENLAAELKAAAHKAVKEAVDIAASSFLQDLKNNTPRSSRAHPHLADALVMVPTDQKGKYGWKVEYQGYNESGTAYELIARSLNRGTIYVQPTRHIDTAIRKLKGLDAKINETYENEIEKIKL